MKIFRDHFLKLKFSLSVVSFLPSLNGRQYRLVPLCQKDYTSEEEDISSMW